MDLMYIFRCRYGDTGNCHKIQRTEQQANTIVVNQIEKAQKPNGRKYKYNK